MPWKPDTVRLAPQTSTDRALQDRARRHLIQRKLLNTARWRNFRLHFLREHPLCNRCLTEAARDVHHVRKLADHPEDLLDETQCEALCHGCHSAATARGE